MKSDWLNLGGRDTDYQSIVDRLSESPFDELVEIDLINDRLRNIYHVEGKYYVPLMNGAWSELCDYCTRHMVHPLDSEAYARMMDPDTMQERMKNAEIPGVLSAELRFRKVDGQWLWTRQVLVTGARNGLPEGVVYCYIYDIDNEKKRKQGKDTAAPADADAIRRDDLTGLLLDRDFFSLAQRKLEELEGGWCLVAVDIENFKLFCDWHGQQAGNILLAEIGEILQRVEGETGGLAGYRGQDDFSLMIPFDSQRVNALYEEIHALIVARGDSVGFMPMFGICMIERDDREIMDIYNRAALTAEQIKGDFKSRIVVYDPETYKKNTEEYQILSGFQRAMENHEIFFCLQPQCRVSTGNVVGAESLARWRAPSGRMIPPVRFVPVLEKYGMITNLDMYIWEEVCVWLRRWIDRGNTPVPISVNVSQIDMFTIDVPAFLMSLLRKYNLPARLIKVEITESAYVEDTAVVRNTVRRLREMGFLVLMDDFGSGYSSLNMLRSLNVDVIKLDAQFLHIDENESRRGISILESIVNMAKTMAIPIIVEGVETEAQVRFMANLGCRYIQGYYFYRPMPVEEFEDLIRDTRRIDLNGFEFKANEQFHTREFLDENVVTDAMLNNILGPVALFRVNGERVDIIRFNQQYYQMVGIELYQLEARRRNILEYFYPEDRETFMKALKRAMKDRLNGAQTMARVYKPNGALVWISMQLYFMEENSQGANFYVSSRDVTEMQYVNQEIPGGYHRCAVDGNFEFYYVSKGFEDMVGYTAEEIREKFDNRFVRLVHPDDVEILMKRAEAIRTGKSAPNKPYRIKRKNDGYIYIVNQSRIMEVDGQVCFQSVAVDVTEVMRLRNQMRLLSRYSSDDVVFVSHKADGRWKYRVVIHGLEQKLGISAKALEKTLNSGEFYRRMDAEGGERLTALTMDALKNQTKVECDFTVTLRDGRPLKLHIKVDPVDEKGVKVSYICVLREG